MKKKLEYILKHNLFIQSIYKIVMSRLLRLAGRFVQTDQRMVLFNSFGGRKYNDSPRVLYESMLSDHRFDGYTFVWAFENPEEFQIPGAKTIRIDTWEYFKTALMAKYWISSVNIERGLQFKKKQTRYLNTWHGAGTKKIGNACRGRRDFNYANVNVMLVQSEFEREIFERDFLVKPDHILKAGFPRSDELFHMTREKADAYKKKLGIPLEKRVILYAPTWRDSVDGGTTYHIAPPVNIARWKERLGQEYVLLFRAHAFTTQIMGLEFDAFIRDMSGYNDINHLLAVADILITDYSTIVYDYSILEKPFLCFGYDYDRYRRARGFYFDMRKEYPMGVIETEEEILNQIVTMDYAKESEKVKSFKKKYIEAGGDAAKRAVSALFQW